MDKDLMQSFRTDLLKILKEDLGDFSREQEVDNYYLTKIDIAIADLLTEDISEKILQGNLGKSAIILYAKLLIKEQDIASNPTLTLLKNKLSCISKGEANG